MVALAVRTFGQSPVVCHARPLLNQAYAAVQRGQWIEAGCRLREAVRLFLIADCEYFDVQLSNRKVRRTPRALLDALRDAGHCDKLCFEIMRNALYIAKRTARLQFVTRREIENAIEALHTILDYSDYLQEPVAAGRLS